MSAQVLTPEAIELAGIKADEYARWFTLLGLLLAIPLTYILIWLYCVTLYRIFKFLVPSGMLIGMFAAALMARVWVSTGITINLFGFKMEIHPTKQGAISYAAAVRTHTMWGDVVALVALVILLAIFGALGVFNLRHGRMTWIWCDSYKQERKRSDWKKADYGKGGDGPNSARCRRCQDLECGGFVVEEKKLSEQSTPEV
ncbi:hypothetical protein LTR56_003688 [Elasticomyces elasticus]|nr:hypothetical protein LTR22_016915 [Elasticomyces elasticus]KAK3655266.1 hypothetical protein LTR56_003688 [Elasticomyces elasticus]KAK4913545.1 hypothetical protein LTR49_018161 [Elasticomyces elasticus]KAK5738617.1 hypothetical protein LTS12_025536 [Elasticomyces elasticus]